MPRMQAAADPDDKRRAIESARSDTTRGAGVRSMQQLVQLRWIALLGQLATILFVHYALEIHLPLARMLGVAGCLAAFNLASLLYWRGRQDVGDIALLAALLVDVVALTAQLHLSGGITNPFVFLFLLQVAVGAVLLPAWASWVVVAASAAGVMGLVVFPGPVTIAADLSRGMADTWLQGLLICFLLTATLAALFIGRIARMLRVRDARLADLRQQAAEE